MARGVPPLTAGGVPAGASVWPEAGDTKDPSRTPRRTRGGVGFEENIGISQVEIRDQG